MSQGDRIKTRRLFTAEERRGRTVVSVTVGLRSERTRLNIKASLTGTHARTVSQGGENKQIFFFFFFSFMDETMADGSDLKYRT